MLNMLWDASHLWGYLLVHALRSLGLPHRVIQASEIAQAGLDGKLLLVPGGSARAKLAALGPAGRAAVLDFVKRGGAYAGFCGGAGLALRENLGLCPWGRAAMADRLQHLVSGHIRVELARHNLVPASAAEALLPVWWPGRFAEEPGPVDVLARYRAPGPDLMVADLPLPGEDVLAEWRNLYGVNVRPSLLDGQPCVVAGEYDRGRYLLSYSHFESPDSPFANVWLCHVLREFGVDGGMGQAVGAGGALLPAWNPGADPVLWECGPLLELRDAFHRLLRHAAGQGLLFPRNAWLMGWKAGVPGAPLNGLRLALNGVLSSEPGDGRSRLWRSVGEELVSDFKVFLSGAESWLMARRLADTLADSAPGLLPRELLAPQRAALFGGPMAEGGLCASLCERLEALCWAE